MVGSDSAVGDDRQRVVLLEEELARGVEADGGRPVLVEQLPGPADDRVHGRVPVGLPELSPFPDQRSGEPVGRGVGLPAVEVLRIEPAAVDPVLCSTPHPDDASGPHRDVEPVAIGMEDRRRRDPRVHIVGRQPVGQLEIDADRPVVPRAIGSALSPRLCDPVHPPPSDQCAPVRKRVSSPVITG
jgi:hypothetical protein